MPNIIIEIRGGNVVEVYGLPEECYATVVDWDNFDPRNEQNALAVFRPDPTRALPVDTHRLVDAWQTAKLS